VVALVLREQGFLVQKGNPRKINELNDISRPGIRFVNRQRGAGTRVLLDYHLKSKGINPEAIQGYNQEEYTHLGVAVAIASGRADCGLGIAAAAKALDLDFIPLFQERYDLIIPKNHAESDLLVPLFAIIAGAEFRTAVMSMPGYDISVMGKLILET
jgi:putative molybdopterin biosynthesis protein